MYAQRVRKNTSNTSTTTIPSAESSIAGVSSSAAHLRHLALSSIVRRQLRNMHAEIVDVPLRCPDGHVCQFGARGFGFGFSVLPDGELRNGEIPVPAELIVVVVVDQSFLVPGIFRHQQGGV